MASFSPSGRFRTFDFLSVKEVSKHFGGVAALTEVTFELEEGSMVGLIGPNGAGKSTLFNVVTGLYKPDSGKILFRGKDITGKAPHRIVRQGIARTFQLNRPFANMTVSENLQAARIATGVSGGLASAVSEALGLAGKENQLAKLLPQGDLKRLEIARALATQPRLLLLDEPFAGLNPEEVTGEVQIIKELRKAGLTVLIIEHVLPELMRLAERLLVMNYGRLIADGTPKEIVNNPQVVAAYLGEGSFSNASSK